MTPLFLHPLIAAAALVFGSEAPAPQPPEKPVEAEAPAADDEPMPLPAAALCVRAEEDLQEGSRSALLHARKLYRLASDWYPADPCGHAGLARATTSVYLRGIEEDDSLIEQALSASRRAAELAPRSGTALASVAAAQMVDLRIEEARATARKAVELEPDSIPALQIAAQIDAATGRHDSGLKSIARALERRPDLPISRQILGNLQLLSGDIGAAIESYRGALTLSTNFPPALMQLAAAYEQAGNLRGSGRLFEQILHDHPEESSRCHLYMGYSLMKRNSWRAALGAFEKVSFKTRRGLSDGTVLFLRGVCHANIGDLEAARAAFREVIEKWPDATGGMGRPERLLSPAYEELARLALKAGDTEGAAAILEEGVSRPGAGPDLHLRLARLYLDYHLTERAEALLEAAASAPFTPRSAEPILAACVARARLARERGDRAALERLAVSLEGRAVALAEMADYVLEVQAARALSIAGRGAAALECLRRARSAGYTQFGWIQSDAEMETVRNAPGFAELVRPGEPVRDPTD